MAKLTIDSGALNRLLRDPAGPVGRHISTTAERIADRARQLVRTDTGALQSAITVVSEPSSAGPAAKVVADLPYATAEHEGTKPHTISPRGPALHFFWRNEGGLETFVPRRGGFITHVDRRGRLWIGKSFVQHPGTPGSFFLTRAAEEIAQQGG